jgi:hypothetical protein
MKQNLAFYINTTYQYLLELSRIIGDILGYAICTIGYICITSLILWVTIIQIYNLTIKIFRLNKEKISSIFSLQNRILVVVPIIVTGLELYSFFQWEKFHDYFVHFSQVIGGLATIATFISMPILIILGVLRIIKKML